MVLATQSPDTVALGGGKKGAKRASFARGIDGAAAVRGVRGDN